MGNGDKEIVFQSHTPFPTPHSPLPKIGLRYFEAQRSLAAFQGQNNLWLAGLYTHDIDSHESAIRSAVKVAEGLDPRSAGLKLLIESHSF